MQFVIVVSASSETQATFGDGIIDEISLVSRTQRFFGEDAGVEVEGAEEWLGVELAGVEVEGVESVREIGLLLDPSLSTKRRTS